MIGIYKITNKVNNKVYIGQSVNIEQRWKDHRTRAFQVDEEYINNHLYRSIRKYGLINFTFEILEECDKEELDSKEIKWIDYFDSTNSQKGYNKTKGGSSAVTISKLTDEQVLEIYNLLLNSTLTQNEIAIKYNVSVGLISGINHGTNRAQVGYTYPLRKIKEFNKQKTNHLCPICGGFKSDTKSKMCISCNAKKRQKVERPNREELKNLIRNTSFVQIGKIYNVSDNAIRKWCISYNLPSKSREIKKFTDIEWKEI